MLYILKHNSFLPQPVVRCQWLVCQYQKWNLLQRVVAVLFKHSKPLVSSCSHCQAQGCRHSQPAGSVWGVRVRDDAQICPAGPGQFRHSSVCIWLMRTLSVCAIWYYNEKRTMGVRFFFKLQCVASYLKQPRCHMYLVTVNKPELLKSETVFISFSVQLFEVVSNESPQLKWLHLDFRNMQMVWKTHTHTRQLNILMCLYIICIVFLIIYLSSSF